MKILYHWLYYHDLPPKCEYKHRSMCGNSSTLKGLTNSNKACVLKSHENHEDENRCAKFHKDIVSAISVI